MQDWGTGNELPYYEQWFPSGIARIGNRSSLLQKNRGYKPLPQEIHPSKNRGYKPLLQEIHPFPQSGLQTPPTKDITPPTRDIPIQVSVTHLTARCQRVEDFKRKCVSPHSHFLSQVVLLGSDMRIHRAFEYA